TDLFDTNSTLQKIKAGEPVSEADLQALVSLVLTQEPDLDLNDLMEYFPETAGHLDVAIRGIIGLDAQAVEARFVEFTEKHKGLNSHQVKFLDLLKDHIRKYGSIDVDDLYEPPFTLFHSEGLDGVFDRKLAEELTAVIRSFVSSKAPPSGVG